MEWNEKKVLVLGTGISGMGAAKVLLSLGAKVVLSDSRKISKTHEAYSLESDRCQVITGEQGVELLDGMDFVVVSPGIPLTIPILLIAKERKIPIWGEVELAYRIAKAPILAVTGTNGKTTTTALLYHVLSSTGVPCTLGGNIGTSLCEQALVTPKNGYIVAELSSYQLESAMDLHVKGAIFLNLTPDHLHRHKTMAAYQAAKENICKNHTKQDFLVINDDDVRVRYIGLRTQGQILRISQKHRVKNGAYYDGTYLVAVHKGYEHKVLARNEFSLRGSHNIENALAVIALAYAMGISISNIREGLRTFSSMEHRIEYVRSVDGVDYYNDSKATNTDATIKALSSFTEPVILLLGGHDKGEDLDAFMEIVKKSVKAVIVTGRESYRLLQAATMHGIKPLHAAGSLEEAVEIARYVAIAGDVVLLSPACSSFDAYSSFEERGRHFKEIVEHMKGGIA